MCVDDEKVVLTSLTAQLHTSLGNVCQTEAVLGPEEAWELFDELDEAGKRVHLVICDWLMPTQRGDEFLIEVRKKYPDISMIMLSGQADPLSVERAKRDANLDAFLSKPWDKDELVSQVRSLLNV